MVGHVEGASDSPSVTWGEVKQVFMDRFICELQWLGSLSSSSKGPCLWTSTIPNVYGCPSMPSIWCQMREKRSYDLFWDFITSYTSQ